MPLEGREDVLHQVADQPASAPRWRAGLPVPPRTGRHPSPLASLPQPEPPAALLALVQLVEELLVAEHLPVLHGVLEDLVGQVDARQRGVGWSCMT